MFHKKYWKLHRLNPRKQWFWKEKSLFLRIFFKKFRLRRAPSPGDSLSGGQGLRRPAAPGLKCAENTRKSRPELTIFYKPKSDFRGKVVHTLRIWLKNPAQQHWTAIKDILRYLKGSRNRGLLYTSSGLTLDQEWTLTLWVDSDYATCPDTRRSFAGYLTFLNKNLLSFNNV